MNTEGRVRAERRLAAILAADVAEYSRLIGADEEGTLNRIRAIRAEVIDPEIAEHHGRLVKTTGDGLLVEFGSVVDALRCATEIQQEMARRNTGNAVAERIEFRIGINVGDVVVEDGDISGDGVNVAARLEALAEPGGICVSARVQEDVAGRLDLTFDDLGEQNVKNILRPIRAFALTADAVAALPMADTPAEPRPTPPKGPRYLRRWIVALTACGMLIVTAGLWWLWQSPKAPSASTTASVLEKVVTPAVPRLSMVVLPFANLSSDPDQEYFADAITDDLTTDLSRIADSFVIARTTAFTYKGKAADVKQIGRDLGVHYVLEGSVRRLGDSVQVNVQLLDSESGAHVWADRVDTDRRDLAEAQSEITGRLARMLNTELIRDIGRRIEQERAADPDARDLVMRARALYMQGFSAETNKKVLDLSERALAIDRDSVDARISIGQTLAASITDNWSNDVEKDQARAEQLLLEALDRDRNRSSAHGAMGLLRRVQGRWAESQADLA
jgi:adenylate cyclase